MAATTTLTPWRRWDSSCDVGLLHEVLVLNCAVGGDPAGASLPWGTTSLTLDWQLVVALPARGSAGHARVGNPQLETVGWVDRAGFWFSTVLSGEIRQVLQMLGQMDCTGHTWTSWRIRGRLMMGGRGSVNYGHTPEGGAGVGFQGRGRPVQVAVGVRGGCGGAGCGGPCRRWGGGWNISQLRRNGSRRGFWD